MKNKIAVYGLFGSYTSAAAEKFVKNNNIKNIEFKEFVFFSDMFNFIDEGNLAFFPIENSNGGTVTQSIDMFPKKDFEIISEFYFKIDHCILGKKNSDLKDIKSVYSHPQALTQCSNFLDKKKITPLSFSDTSAAAKKISETSKEDKKYGAIGSKDLAKIYGLKVLKNDFQNSKNNITRFFLVKKKNKKYDFEKKIKKDNKTTILFETKNIPGSLYKCLGAFATNGINLTKIESRPSTGEKNFNYFFIVDFMGNLEDKNVKTALEELNFFTEKIKFFGSY
jgi:prephenate dehydratase